LGREYLPINQAFARTAEWLLLRKEYDPSHVLLGGPGRKRPHAGRRAA
jgi:hypothetical protein